MQAKLTALLGPDGTPPGALRILSRRNEAEILIANGDRAVGSGEKLGLIEFFPSTAIAEAVAVKCAEYLQTSGTLLPDGWHDFALEHTKKLVRVAKNHLCTGFTEDEDPDPRTPRTSRERQSWTARRNARLAFLVGLGWTAKMIASDPLVRSTPGMVYRQAHKLEVYLSDTPQGQVHLQLPATDLAIFDRAARSARLTRDAFLRSFLIRAAATL